MKKLFPILIFTLLLFVSTVTASDMNQTTQNTSKSIEKTEIINNNSLISQTNIQQKTINNTSTTKSLKTSTNTIYISNSGNDNNNGNKNTPKKTITSALNTVSNGGTIYISSGTFYENKLYINKNITLIGNGAKNTIINCNGKHGFTISDNSKVTFKTLTITNTKNTNGGAIYNKGTLELNGVKISSSNATHNGGAIYNKGKLNIMKTSFSNNYAKYGGAIYNLNQITVTKSTFNKNNAELGSVIYSLSKLTLYSANITHNYHSPIYLKENTTSTIKLSNFLNNTGTCGGAIHNLGILLVNKTYFYNNTATKYGGAIYNKGTLNSYNNTYTHNYAKENGGAIYNTNKLYIKNNSIKINKAGSHGGAIYNTHILSINSTKFTSNKCGNIGGAIYNLPRYSNPITINNSQFSSNIATYGGAIYEGGYAKLIIAQSIFNANKNHAIYFKTNTKINTITNSTFIENNATNGGAIYNLKSNITLNKVTIKSNHAKVSGGAIYSYNGTIIIKNSIIINNDNIDLYNAKGIIIANYNWWGSNSKLNNLRQYNSTINNWIYLTVTSSKTSVNQSVKTTISINNIFNGTIVTSYNTSSYLPTIKLSMSIVGCNVNKTYKNLKGSYTATNTFNSVGIATITAYTYNQKLKTSIVITHDKITSLFVQIGASVTSSTVNSWIKAGITDVYVQTRASTNNTTKLKQVITLCKNTSIRVHAWVICFSTSNGFNIGSSQQTMIKNFIYTIIRISGVDGVCLDYVRYSGANKSIVNSSKITNFVKSVHSIVKTYDNKKIISACVFAEMAGTKTYYGQDYAALSPYVDVMLPMAYKYDYNANRSWLQKVTKYVVNQAKYSKVVTVLQTYSSSSSKLSKSELEGDAKAVMSVGSYGYSLFRYGLIKSYPTSAVNLS
ncbi:hypothetical protein [Methanosphaera sp. WGK6]|uniref:hypothetical protein n=1 Tax=Methanosphaera sp. WGK6 TaxID=1561964 RepID=UPI00084BD145|nr:hypothetical protein [Methanosphaera sp. WGK6]OED30598.1 hypothetical protein NL43_01235 [Methanosphaera sp. WGK6]